MIKDQIRDIILQALAKDHDGEGFFKYSYVYDGKTISVNYSFTGIHGTISNTKQIRV